MDDSPVFAAPSMRARVAAFDWSRTPLGPQEQWPPSLRTAVGLMLPSTFPMTLLWGEDLIQIYNDGYAVILGARHPGALGRPTREVWPEVWHIDEPLYMGVRRGQTFSFENQLYPLTRRGFVEEAYFTLCYSPVEDDAGAVGGVLVTVTETTAQVLGARRMNVLREHAEALSQVQTVADLCRLVQTFRPGPDVPFADLFLNGAGPLPHALLPVVQTREPRRLDWTTGGQPPRLALALPVDGAERGEASGVLVLGLNPRVPPDGAYRDFLDSYARQAASALVRVRSGEQAELNRRLEEERAALDAFFAFTRAVGTETDLDDIMRRAIEVLRARFPGCGAAYYELEGDLFRGRVLSEGTPPEATAVILRGFPAGGRLPLFAHPLHERTPYFKDGWNAQEEGVPHSDPYQSAASFPLIVAGEVRGVFTVGMENAARWNERDKALVNALWRGLTLALERAEQTRQLDEDRAALEAFAHFTAAAGTETDVRTLVGRAITLLGEGYGAEAMYFEREGELFRARLWGPGFPPGLLARSREGFTLDYPDIARAVRGRQMVFVDGWEAPTRGVEESAVFGAVAFQPFFEGDEVTGVFAAGLRGRARWSGRERGVFRALGQGLTLALERAGAVRALAEEREALAAFARFTEETAGTSDVGTLAQRAAEVLHLTLNVRSAVYFEQEGGLWRARHVSGATSPHFEQHLRAGLPLGTPSFALPAERREPMFFERYDAAADGVPDAAPYRAVARYPLLVPDRPAAVLGMGSTEQSAFTERERAVFRAVGDSFRLALERAARMEQIERQRERLADLNAELGTFITRTAHNLEVPARRLGHLLNPGRPGHLGAPEGLPPYDPAALGDEVARLRGVARDLRQLSRLEGRPLARELLPLGEVFGEVLAEVRAAARGGQADWLVEPLPIVRGDRALLKQALGALMTFTLSGTRGARYVTVGSREVEGEVQVTVEDDGMGLTGEEAATLFDLAVRTDQEVPLLPGSGLVQVRRVLARHGGWAWAEARRSGGKVVLAFPRDEAVNRVEALFRQDRPGT